MPNMTANLPRIIRDTNDFTDVPWDQLPRRQQQILIILKRSWADEWLIITVIIKFF
jgi:hypothetical protein